MQNDAGELADLYIPRKWIISAKDHASIQLDIVRVDPVTGRMIDGEVTRYAICGKLRFMGESDDCILRLAQKDGIIPNKM
uniref:40S ribosomal protein S21 n=1 Tax=Meloidogyne javanica TaxID=6303 RepID=A0A915NDS8_MELJA